jgi:hypothetical protein
MPGAMISNFFISSLKNLLCISDPFALVTEDDGLFKKGISQDLEKQAEQGSYV